MQVEIRPVYAHSVNAEMEFNSLFSVLMQVSPAILFVENSEGHFIGAITQGDVNKATSGNENIKALDICNANAMSLPVDTPEHVIAKFFTPRITAIPLISSDGKLASLAVSANKHSRRNLNVGAGGEKLTGFVNLDVPSSWYAQRHADDDFVPFDMCHGSLPFDDMTVDNIYCSHVLEHVEDSVAERFIGESARVLKKGGVLRIACPDVEFLANVSCFDNDYWVWRREWFLQHRPDMPLDQVEQEDFLVREVATARVGDSQLLPFPKEPSQWNSYFAMLKQGISFSIDTIGNHINAWTFERLFGLATSSGFTQCIRSKYQGCVSRDMVGSEFDKTRPEMSLYVDLVR